MNRAEKISRRSLVHYLFLSGAVVFLFTCREPAGNLDASCLDALAQDACTADALNDANVVLDGAVKDFSSTDTSHGSFRVRIMAANLTSGNHSSYDLGEGIRIFQGLKPDVVLIQEFNYGDNSPAALRSFVDLAFGAEFSYTRESESGDLIPNGVISRYPIVEAGEWPDTVTSNRDFAWAHIALPDGQDLWAVSLHLLTTHSDRLPEAKLVVSYLQQNIPEDALVMVGGDFNTDTRGESCIDKLGEALVIGEPYPTDQANNSSTNAGRTKPYDWLLADNDLQALATPVVIGANSFPSGLVFDSRAYQPLADVAPVRTSDSQAVSMQHMAVVRDFYFP